MSLASNPTPKSREGSLLLPAVRLTVWRELGQVLQREHVMGYLLVLPAVLLLVGLVAYPFVIALWLSLTDAYVWRGLPFYAITLLAGLMSINPELYEAAESDGAGAWARFRYITLPLLRPVLAVVILFSTILTFADFNIVYVLTRGGPVNSTHLF